MLEASEGVEEQEGLVRGPPAAPGELADAVEPGEQDLPGQAVPPQLTALSPGLPSIRVGADSDRAAQEG